MRGIYTRVGGNNRGYGFGEVVAARLNGDPGEAAGTGYISHFATCPKAGSFRRQ